jgi:hypothetical protein
LRAQAPALARLQAPEAVLGTRRDQVIALLKGKRQELGGHAGTHHVPPAVVRPGAAATIPKKAGERIEGASGQHAPQDVAASAEVDSHVQ